MTSHSLHLARAQDSDKDHSEEISERTLRGRLVRTSLDFIGVPYSWGGASPKTGMDCSAFVRRVYSDQSLDLPRVSRAQFDHTQTLPPEAALPGDLVFFNLARPGRKTPDHVGIYLGSGLFVHASRSRGVVVEPIDQDVYKRSIIGIRRHKVFTQDS